MVRGLADAIAFGVLELLANEAPLADFEDLVTQARRNCTSDEDGRALDRLSRLSLAIHSQSRRHKQREIGLSTLVDTARDLATLHDLDTLLKVITRRARLLLGADMSYISIPDEKDESCYIRTSDGHTSTLSVGLRLPSGSGLGSGVLASSTPFWTSDYLIDERIRHSTEIDEVVRAEGLHAMMGVPLSHRTQPFGVLYVADRDVRYFTTDEIAVMSSLGDLAGVAIEKTRLLAQSNATVSALERHISGAEAGLREMREITDVHHLLIDSVLGGADPQALAAEASRRLGAAIRVHAPDTGVLASAGELSELDEDNVVAAAMDAHAAPGPVEVAGGLWAAPMRAGAANLGTLLLRPSPAHPDRGERLSLLSAQAMAVALLLDDSRAATAVGQLRDELLDELLSTPQRPPQHIATRARRLGIDLNTPHIVVVARPEGNAQAKVAAWASLYAHRMSGLKGMRNGQAVLLLPGADPGAAARAVCEELTPLLGQQVTVSAAGPVSAPATVFHSYQEALRCLDAMTSLGTVGGFASVRELGFVGVLLSDNGDVEGFISTAIGPVLDYDQQRLTELARTLDAYFASGCSPTYAAQILHVHTNTVARRLERISKLLGPDWQEPRRSLEIQLALKLAQVRAVLAGRRPLPSEARRDAAPPLG